MNQTKEIQITKFKVENRENKKDWVAVEEPLEIKLNKSQNPTIKYPVSITMRTPGNDTELAVGFLFTEGLISNIAEISSIHEFPDSNRILITLNENSNFDSNQLQRNFYTTSSCGVCGKASIDAIKTVCPFHLQASDIVSIDQKTIYSICSQLNENQSVFKETGGIHASALFTLRGEFITLREDVGRHNALDKLIGWALQDNALPLTNTILLLSGRASFELIQKAGMAGIPYVLAIGAPSSLAIEIAQEMNICLIGFLKENRFNVYGFQNRIY